MLKTLIVHNNTVEPRLSEIRLIDLPGYPTYHTEPSTPRYPTKIG